MQISPALSKKPILFNIGKRMHDTVTEMVSMSRSVILMKTIIKCYREYLFSICKLATAIIAKTTFLYCKTYLLQNICRFSR